VTITYLFAGIPVSDRDASAAWYSRLFGTEPMYPNDAEAMWQVVGTGSLYVLVDANAGAGTVTLIVDDLDASVDELRGRGFEVAEPIVIPGAGRKALIRDPDGNQVWYVGLGGT
jgi:predicted enzyme related to lactoylglutathione lyase